MGSLSGLLSQICCTLVVLSQNYDMRQVLFLKPEISSIKKYMRSRIFVNIISDNNIWSIHCYTTLPCKQNHRWKSESHFTYTLLMMRNPHLLSYRATYTSPVHRALVWHVIKLKLFFHCPEQQPWLSKFLNDKAFASCVVVKRRDFRSSKLVSWFCFTSHRQQGHLETASNSGPSRGSPLHYRCAMPAPQRSSKTQDIRVVVSSDEMLHIKG